MRPIGRLLPIGTCVLALVLSSCGGGSGKKTPTSPGASASSSASTSSGGSQAAEKPLESEPMEHSDGPAPGQTVDPGSADLGQPMIRDLVGTSESAEEAVDKKGDDTRVRIAADVLFALNKADLTPRADTVLKALAQQIDASPSKTVPI